MVVIEQARGNESLATRAIKLKLIVPRGSSDAAATGRLALWTLHSATNEAVAFYEERLLEMRQGDVRLPGPDGCEHVRPADEWRAALRERLISRGVASRHLDEAALAFTSLYADLVQSRDVPNRGSAQDAAKWHGALCSKASHAGEQKFVLVERWGWVVESPEPPPGWRERILQDRELEDFRPTGAPPSWRRRRNRGDDDWPEYFLADVRKKRAEAEGEVARRLRDFRALPLFEPVIRLQASRGDLNPFERSALSLAVAHLNQWESWRHRGEARVAELKRRIADADERGVRFGDAIAKLSGFERERELEIASHGFWVENSKYSITFREIRGWDRLREWLRAHPTAGDLDSARRVREIHQGARGEVGAADVLHWLAAPAQRSIATHADGDPVRWFVARNRLARQLESARSLPRFTFADARLHPRFADLDAPHNANKPHYRIRSHQAGRLQVTIPGLLVDGSGYVQHEVVLDAAPSRQLREVELQPNKRGQVVGVKFRSQDGLDLSSAVLRGGALVFDRGELQGRTDAQFGRLYIKLALEVDAEADTLRANRKLARYFKGSILTRSKKDEHPDEVRVLGVDLGLRSAAACAVYRWSRRDSEPQHERSFVLRLPGERAAAAEKGRRDAATKALARARNAVARMQDVARVYRVADDRLREQRFAELRDRWPVDSHDLPEVSTREELRVAWGQAEAAAGQAIHDLVALHRVQRARRGSSRVGGKSFWRLADLEQTLRILRSWARRQHIDDEQVKRFDRTRAGTVGRRLLAHVNALRQDRVKTIADLVVQAARGRAYGNGRWEQRYPAVNLVVLEDLSRYRFRTDRPRHENSQLMRWSHRALAEQVEMQAEIHGIAVDDAPPEFSSRFDATTGAPGLRCRRLTKADLRDLEKLGEAHWLAKRVGAFTMSAHPAEGVGGARRHSQLLSVDQLKSLSPGALVPTGDGDQLVFPANGGRLSLKHADLNAAQNVAVRYLTAFCEPIRVVAYEVSSTGGTRLLAKPLGKRLQSWFGAEAAVFEPHGDGFVARGTRSTAVGGETPEEGTAGAPRGGSLGEGGGDDLMDEIHGSLSERHVLFRDPSGFVADPSLWYGQKPFWGRVRSVVVSRLEAKGWRVEP